MRAVARDVSLAAVPAAATALVAALSTGGAEGLFRADAAGLVASVAVAAFGESGLVTVARRTAIAVALLAVAHAVAAAALGLSVGGAPALALLAVGVMVGASGLAALARAGGVPSPAGSAVAAAVLWTSCGGLWWADDLAANAEPTRRGLVRQAVLDLDPLTAAAYGCAGLDRLRLPEVYDRTTIATVAVAPPSPATTAAWWGAAGLVAAGAAAGARRARRGPRDVP